MKLRDIHNFLSGTLRGRLILGVAVVHAVMMTLFITDLTLRQRSMLLDRQEEAATALSQSLSTSAAGWLAADDISGLQELVENQRHYPELLFAMLIDKGGRVLAHTDKSRQGLYLLDLPKEARQTVVSKTPDLVDVAVPAILGGRHVGWARVGIGQKTAGQKLRQITRSGALYAIAAIILGTVIASLIGRHLTRRLYAVQDTINKVRAGNHRARSSITGNDEAALLAREFNDMLDALSEHEAELNSSEARFTKLFNTAAVPLCFVNKEGVLVDFNDRFAQTFGYTHEEVPTLKEWWNLAYPDPAYRIRVVATWEAAVRRASEEKTDIEPIEYRVTCKSGEVRTMVISGTTIDEDFLAIFFDITERKKAEEEIRMLTEELEKRVTARTAELIKKSQELEGSQKALINIVDDLNQKTWELEQANIKLKELDRLKSMFISSMSHELRTPLNSIIGFSSILLHEWLGPVNDEQKKNLATVLRSGEHLLSLINDVIDVSKIEAGKVEAFADEFDISDVISEAVDLLAKNAEDKGLELKIEAIHQIMRTDRRRLLQCVINLLSNAVKFTVKGGVRVSARLISSNLNPELRSRISELDGDFMEISVTDTGVGIKAEDMSKLFQPFMRLESTVGAAASGTGLGLYLTNKLVAEILKGDIICSSRYGEGSSFTMRLPVKI
ncbi:MAG: PAS domain S-box protein [Nitrospirae bacterium]|nr:PAS domain S-box protein [Nitrospirota bacterium]